MSETIIKICGITDPNMAKLAIIAGANLIGIVFHPSSSRYVTPNDAIAIVDVIKRAGAIPVGVFVDHKALEMCEICDKTNIETIQLHGVVPRIQHRLLPKHYRRIYVQNISENGALDSDEKRKYLNAERDLILIDHKDPGKGKSINRKNFHYDLPFSWLLAGGLTPFNVGEAIADLHPDGVDVSSGVESSKGVKSPILIKKFVASVKGYHND